MLERMQLAQLVKKSMEEVDERNNFPLEMGSVATPSRFVCSGPSPPALPTSPTPSASTTASGSWQCVPAQSPREIQEPVQVDLLPLEPNCVRVHISHDNYRDVQINIEDNTMQGVYEVIQKDFPAAVLTTYCPGNGKVGTAIFRTDNRVSQVIY